MNFRATLVLHAKTAGGGYVYVHGLTDYDGILVTKTSDGKEVVQSVDYLGKEYETIGDAVAEWKKHSAEMKSAKEKRMAAKRVFKSKKKLSGEPMNFRKWADWDEGDYVVGEYVGIHTDQYDKECMKMKVEDAVFSNKKEAKNVIGKVLVLNAAGQLNKAMEKMDEGQFVQVTYNGMSTIETGKYAGKESHVLDIQLMEEESDDDDSDEDEDLDDDDTEEDDEDEDFDL